MEFHSIQELNKFIADNEDLHLKKIENISNDKHLFLYYMRGNEILYFNYEKSYGKFYNYLELKPISVEIGFNLRDELSEMIGGVQFSRSNYILLRQQSSNLTAELINIYLNKVKEKLPIRNGELSDADLDKMSTFLNSLTIKERMEYEIPILMTFLKYGVEKYKTVYEIRPLKNQFGEDYFYVSLRCNGVLVNLSHHIFRALFPDPDRDDYHSKGLKEINLKIIKVTIDAFHRVNVRFESDN